MRVCDSDSMTHGPAIRKSGLAPPRRRGPRGISRVRGIRVRRRYHRRRGEGFDEGELGVGWGGGRCAESAYTDGRYKSTSTALRANQVWIEECGENARRGPGRLGRMTMAVVLINCVLPLPLFLKVLKSKGVRWRVSIFVFNRFGKSRSVEFEGVTWWWSQAGVAAPFRRTCHQQLGFL